MEELMCYIISDSGDVGHLKEEAVLATVWVSLLGD